MEEGFQIEIQKNITDDELSIAKKFANEFISKTCRDHMIFYLGGRTGGYISYIRRGKFGYVINKETGLVFRRISRNKRIFGIVKYTELLDKDTNKLPRADMCVCPKHRGCLKVKWKTKRPETFVYARGGQIKGQN